MLLQRYLFPEPTVTLTIDCRNGELSQDYNGPREANGIVKYMAAQAGPATKELTTKDELEKFLSKPEVTIVSFLSGSDLETFKKTASALRETAAFGHFTGSGSDKSGVILHRPKTMQTKLEESELTYSGKISKDGLSAWIKDNYHGLVGHRTTDNMGDFKEPLVIAYYDVDYVKNAKGTNYWRNRVMKVAKGHTGLNFAVSNKMDFMQEAQVGDWVHILRI
jgi:protein disulfide isomerase family A protein 3